jgi:GR25 family glycosyltransferase involved in LPS biosynthesis
MIHCITSKIYYINCIFISLFFIYYFYINIYYLNNVEDFTNTINEYYVISLNNTNGLKKWEKMKNTILGEKLKKIDGIDGRKININEYINKNLIISKWDHGKWKYDKSNYINMSQTEIGCCLSHLKVWNKINDENIEMAMILEDDAHNFNINFKTILNDILNNAPEDWDIILLGYGITEKMRNKEIKVNTLYKVKEFILTHCYLIRLKCVRTLLKLVPINSPIDTWLSSNSDKINIYRHNIARGKNDLYSSLITQNTQDFKGEIYHTNDIYK